MQSQSKILDLSSAVRKVKNWQSEGLKVVFTNGCFDLLHLGHVDYLEKAGHLGDKLAVALNTDDSIQRLKGKSRPVLDEVSRQRIMAALEFVDLVILFDEDTPLKVIEAIRPDILVKGSDYLAENIVGTNLVKSYGGEVKTLPLVEGKSTSEIINRILYLNKK